jgi:hypothetical protein
MAKDLDQLMETLVADLEPVKPLHAMGIVPWLIIGLVLAHMIVVAATGMRADLSQIWSSDFFLIRGAMMVGLLVLASWTAVRLVQPGRSAPSPWIPVALSFGLPLVIGGLAALDGDLAERLFPETGIHCLQWVVTGALPVVVAMTLWMKRGAALSPTRVAWMIGLAGGLGGALAYTWHCPSTDPFYVAFWYPLGVGLAMVGGRLVSAPFLRW